jgi:hypothetical protein
VLEFLLASVPRTVSGWADLASILSLAGTVWVLVGIWNISAFYLLRVRLPALNNRLKEHAGNLSNYLNDFPAFKNDALKELAVADATLRSLRKKLPRAERRLVSGLLSSLKRLRRDNPTERALRDFYLQLLNVHEQLKEKEIDLRWER